VRSKYTISIGIILLLTAIAAGAGLLINGLGTPPLPKPRSSGTAAIGGAFTLTATNGTTVTDKTSHGKWLLVFFGYTYCPDACPTTLNNMSVALEMLGSDANKLQPFFITVDPQRDTREVMADYLKSFDSRILGLTGTQNQIGSVVKEYRVYVAQQESNAGGDNYLVSHSAYIYLMNPQGQFVNVIQGNEPGDSIAAWIRKEIGSFEQLRR
jgi:protein SCO1/2